MGLWTGLKSEGKAKTESGEAKVKRIYGRNSLNSPENS